MKRFSKRIDKLEAALNPRGKRRSDGEEEKRFHEFIERIKTWPDVKVFEKLFEIEKEQAKKEERPLEIWWNVCWLMENDPMDYSIREKIKLSHRCPPLTEEHRHRVKELFLQVGHPLGKTM